MKKVDSSADEIKAIRQLMEDASKFTSLSGLSGIFMGLFAITGASFAWLIFRNAGGYQDGIDQSVLRKITAVALSVLLLSLGTGFWFSLRKARRAGKSFWTPVSKRMVINLFIPLATGGAFALILLFQGNLQLIVPVFLIFYGFSLINAGKFTYNEIFYLGIIEISLGLLCSLFPALAIVFWILGFGILHIIYGVYMYKNYEA